MKRSLPVAVGLLSCVFVVAATAGVAVGTTDSHPVHTRPVIFDNDMDFDDTAALAYLARFHKAGRIDLRLVSITSAGAAFPGRGIQFARCLLERFGITDVPVVDSSRPGVNAFPSFLRLTFDQILSDTLVGCTASAAPSAVSAPEAIVNELQRSERPITIIATGPLTNLADAVGIAEAREPGRPFASMVQQLWVVGGVFDAPGGLCCGLVPPFDDTQTFNFWADPPAIQAALTGLRPAQVSMVSHNATDMVPIRIPYIKRLGAEGVTPEAQYLHALMSHPIIIFGLTQGQEGFWWDPVGVVAATLGDFVQFDFRRLRIVQSGPSMGATVATDSHDDSTLVRYGYSAEQGLFEDAFLAGLNLSIP